MSLNSATVRENSPLIDPVHITLAVRPARPTPTVSGYCPSELPMLPPPPVRTGWGGLISPNLKAFPSVYRFNSPKFLVSGAFRTT